MGLLTRLFGKAPAEHTSENVPDASGTTGEPATTVKVAGLPDTPPPTYPRLRRGQPRQYHFAYLESEDWFRKTASSTEARPHAEGHA